jgi:hypothetical protein
MIDQSYVAVIGAGYWGKNLVRVYHELGVLKLVCDNNEMLLERLQEQYPEVETCLAFNDMLLRESMRWLLPLRPKLTLRSLVKRSSPGSMCFWKSLSFLTRTRPISILCIPRPWWTIGGDRFGYEDLAFFPHTFRLIRGSAM